ncbi:phytoene/squalene synthase family protein [soil metagenome]
MLETEILREVSRSFYLTLRLLPGRLRGTMSLGYLLARATDTVADSAALPAAERAALLAQMGRAIGGDQGREDVGRALRERVVPACEDCRERALVGRFEDCLAWLDRMRDDRRESVRAVLRTIVAGQLLDVERFGSDGGGALASGEELDEYTYLVAGSVGEFWTGRIIAEYPRAIRGASATQMGDWGIRYGKGLQLVNILRDRMADEAAGRRYLPEGEPVPRWEEACAGHLEAGLEYVLALRPGRLRLASALPLLLAGRTLQRVRGASDAELARGVKVPRPEVKRLLLVAAVGVFSDRWLAADFSASRRNDA